MMLPIMADLLRPLASLDMALPTTCHLLIFYTISFCLFPYYWIETAVFVLLGNARTSFRMFPPVDIHPEYPAHHTYCFALTLLYHIPWLVKYDAWREGDGVIGMLLRPVTRISSPRTVHLIMFARCWLFMACTNAAFVEFLRDRSWPNLFLIRGILISLLIVPKMRNGKDIIR